MRFLRRSLTGLFMVALTLALLGLAGQSLYDGWQIRSASPDSPRPARERVYAINLVTAQPETVTPLLHSFGEVRSQRTLILRAPAAGTVLEIASGILDGAPVTEGQVILRLDPADATTARDLAAVDLKAATTDLRDAVGALDLARDEVAAARAQAELRAHALTRQGDLVKRGVGSEALVETAALAASVADQAVLSRRAALATAETRAEQAQTTLERRRIALAEAERYLADSVLRAGFTGTLADVRVVEGSIVTANEELARIIDPARLEVSFRLTNAQFQRLTEAGGAPAPAPLIISLDVGGAEIVALGHLSRVGAAVGSGQTGRLVYAALDAVPGFRPGDFVTVSVQEPALDQVITLPAAALSAEENVLALTADNRLEEIPVTLLRRQGDLVLVSAPALAGREVVETRAPTLGAGIKVRPVRPVKPGADVATATAIGASIALIDLAPERRAQLIAYVTDNATLPAEARTRLLAQLSQNRVPQTLVTRLERRMGG